jgi:hypothetical protein
MTQAEAAAKKKGEEIVSPEGLRASIVKSLRSDPEKASRLVRQAEARARRVVAPKPLDPIERTRIENARRKALRESILKERGQA